MKKRIRVTESELINSIEKIVKEQTAVLGFGNTNGFNNLGMGRPTDKYRELGETGGGNYSINLYNDPSATQDGMGIFEDDEEAGMMCETCGKVHEGACGGTYETQELDEQQLHYGDGWISPWDDKPWMDDFDDVWGNQAAGGGGGGKGSKREMEEDSWALPKKYLKRPHDEVAEQGEMDEVWDGGYKDDIWKTPKLPGSWHKPYWNENEELEENCGELDEGGCGGSHDEEMYEDSYALPKKYLKRPHDEIAESNLSRLVRNELIEAQAKEAKKWIQGAVKRPGALRKKLGVGKDKDISLAMIDRKMKQIKAKGGSKKIKGQGLTKSDLRTYKQLNLAKSLKAMSKKKYAKEAKRYRK